MRRSIIGRQSFVSRGALSNPAGRFDRHQLAEVDDGWYQDEVPESIPTTLEPDRARQALVSRVTAELPSWAGTLRLAGVQAFDRHWTVTVDGGRVKVEET